MCHHPCGTEQSHERVPPPPSLLHYPPRRCSLHSPPSTLRAVIVRDALWTSTRPWSSRTLPFQTPNGCPSSTCSRWDACDDRGSIFFSQKPFLNDRAPETVNRRTFIFLCCNVVRCIVVRCIVVCCIVVRCIVVRCIAVLLL